MLIELKIKYEQYWCAANVFLINEKSVSQRREWSVTWDHVYKIKNKDKLIKNKNKNSVWARREWSTWRNVYNIKNK
jgi:hypothetical protein